jgi:hypothetical protein
MSSPIKIRRRRFSLKATLGMALFLLAGGARGEPRIVLSEDLWDFGNITATYPVGHVFKVKNVGDQPLVIDHISAGCGCTTTTLSQNTIDPGKEVLLGLTFNSATLAPGTSAEKSLTITCNDPQTPAKVVRIKAGLSYQGAAGIGIEPKWIRLEKREGKRAVWKKVVLTNQHTAAVEVKVLEAAGAITQARLTQNRIPSNGSTELRLLVNRQKLTGTDPLMTSAGNSVTLAFITERREERVTLPAAMPNEGPKTQAARGDQPRRGKS